MIKAYDAQVFNTIYKLSKTTSIDNLTTKLFDFIFKGVSSMI